jgi:hypothetical protein
MLRRSSLLWLRWLSPLLALAYGCSSELVGGGAEFTGAPGLATAGHDDSESDEPEAQNDEPTSDDLTVEPPPGEEPPDEPVVVDEEGQCLKRPAGVKALLDFETPPPSAASHANAAITRDYEATHGVTFSASGGHDVMIRWTTRLGEAQPPAADEAWRCILCAGSPSRNRLANAAAEAAVGRYMLSSTAAAQKESATLRVDYTIPVSSLSFDLVDVDGDEVWIVEAFDVNGALLPDLTRSVTVSGYQVGATGNGVPTRVSLATGDASRTVAAFVIRGDKPSQLFGFAFDNFETGIPDCAP